jgi:hypothetical protein
VKTGYYKYVGLYASLNGPWIVEICDVTSDRFRIRWIRPGIPDSSWGMSLERDFIPISVEEAVIFRMEGY